MHVEGRTNVKELMVRIASIFGISVALALAIEQVTRFRTVGAYVCYAIFDNIGGGMENLRYVVPIVVGTDIVASFVLVSVVYGGVRLYQKHANTKA